MTAEEVLMMQGAGRGYGYGMPHEYYVKDHKDRHSGQRATAIAFGAAAIGLSVIGLPLVAALAKSYSGRAEAMATGAYNAIAQNSENIRLLTTGLANEANARQIDIRTERSERLQSNPTVQSYIDLAAGAGAYSGSGANSASEAASTAAALALQSGSYGRSGQVCPTPVALYQPAMPCSCNTCNG